MAPKLNRAFMKILYNLRVEIVGKFPQAKINSLAFSKMALIKTP